MSAAGDLDAPGAGTGASVARRVASNTAVQVAGRVIVMGVGLASVAVMTRYLGPRDYGQYALALSYTQLFGVIADIGLFTIVVREIARTPAREEELVGNALGLRLVIGLAAVALAAAVSLLLPYPAALREAIVVAGGALVINLLASAITAVFNARLRMELAVVADVGGRLAAFAGVGAVVWAGLGLQAMVGTAVLGAVISLVLSAGLARRLVPVRVRADGRVWRELVGASTVLGVALAINVLYFRVDTFLISLYRPYREVGLYALDVRIVEIALAVPAVFIASVFPVISRYAAGDAEMLRSALQHAADVCLAIGVPVAAGGALLAGPIVALAAGPDYEAAAGPLRVLMVAAGLISINGLLGFTIVAAGRQASALWLNVLALVLNVGLNLALIPPHGILAAAWVTLGCEVVILAASAAMVRRFLGFGPGFGLLPRAALAAAVMCLVLWPLDSAPALVGVPVGAVVYVAVLYAVAGERREALRRLRPSGP